MKRPLFARSPRHSSATARTIYPAVRWSTMPSCSSWPTGRETTATAASFSRWPTVCSKRRARPEPGSGSLPGAPRKAGSTAERTGGGGGRFWPPSTSPGTSGISRLASAPATGTWSSKTSTAASTTPRPPTAATTPPASAPRSSPAPSSTGATSGSDSATTGISMGSVAALAICWPRSSLMTSRTRTSAAHSSNRRIRRMGRWRRDIGCGTSRRFSLSGRSTRSSRFLGSSKKDGRGQTRVWQW